MSSYPSAQPQEGDTLPSIPEPLTPTRRKPGRVPGPPKPKPPPKPRGRPPGPPTDSNRYRATHKPNVILQEGHRELSERIQDLTGCDQRQADQAIDSVTLAIKTWIEAMVSTIPEGTRATLLLQDLGSLIVAAEPKKGHRTWIQKITHTPKPIILSATFEPNQRIRRMIASFNKQSRLKARDHVVSAIRYQSDITMLLHPNSRWRLIAEQSIATAAAAQNVANPGAPEPPNMLDSELQNSPIDATYKGSDI